MAAAIPLITSKAKMSKGKNVENKKIENENGTNVER